MTVYNFTGTQTISNFNPATDIISIGTQSISGANVTIGGSSGSTTLSDSQGTLTLTGIANNALTSSNFSFVNGSIIDVGANSTTPGLNGLTNQHTLTGTGSDQIFELGGADSLTDSTTAGLNLIRGGSGNDTISIGSGGIGDTVVTGGGSDSVVVNAGDTGPVTIWGGSYASYSGMNHTAVSAANTITGSLAGGFIHGASSGNSLFTVGAVTGNETVITGAGNDTVAIANASGARVLAEGGTGADSISDTSTYGHDSLWAGAIGGATPGNGFTLDAHTAANTNDVFYGDGANGSINSGTGIGETVHGGAGAVLITSYSANSVTTGSTFDLEKGNSTFVGSTGNSFDTVNGGSGTDVIDVGTLTQTSSLDVLIGSGATTLNDTGTTTQGTLNFIESATSTGVDTYNVYMIGGTADANIVNIVDLKSTDVVNVTLGGTSIDASALTVTAYTGGTLEVSDGTVNNHPTLDITGITGSGSIAVAGTATDAIYYNESGTGTILGSATMTGNDLLVGGTGNDTIYTGTGLDNVLTGTGADSVIDSAVNVGASTIEAGGGSDSIQFTGTAGTVTIGGATNAVSGFIDYKIADATSEHVSIGGSLATGSLTTNSNVTIDGSATSGAETIVTSASASQPHLDILLGNGADKVDLNTGGTDTATATIVAGTGADTIVASSGADTIAGAGSGGGLSITSGAANDSISLGAHTLYDTVVDANSTNGANIINLSGFTTTLFGSGTADDIGFSDGALAGASVATGFDTTHTTVLVGLGATSHANGVTAAAAGANAVVTYVSGATAPGATSNILALGTVESAANLALTAISSTGGSTVTTGFNTNQYDGFILAYSDGTNGHVGVVEVITAPGAGTIPVADMAFIPLVTINGLTSITSTTFASGAVGTGDFHFFA